MDLRLQTWFSPSFPTGAFAYSHGLESAVELGAVTCADELRSWTEAVLRSGTGRTDSYFFRRAHGVGAVEAAKLSSEARAWTPTAELEAESGMQGQAFLDAARAGWPHPELDRFAEAVDGKPAIPVAAGFSCGAHGLKLADALPFYLQALAGSIISAGQRAVPVGQRDALRIAAHLEPVVSLVAARIDREPVSSTPAAEVYSMLHETQHSRIFRS